MNKKICFLISVIILLLTSIIISPIALTIPIVCTIRGYVIVDGVATQPDEILLSFPDEEDILADHMYEDGYYEIMDEMEPGKTGYFYVTISGQGTWQAEENISIQNDVYFYKINLTVDTDAEENQPPNVDIIKPEKGIYFNDHKLFSFFTTLIIGRITVEADATDPDDDIDRLEFYIDDDLEHTRYEEPYTWIWDERILFHKCVLKVIVYDESDNMDQDTMTIYVLNLDII
ncbi:MAG: hypothetical protein JSW62_05015 [Thermoplasmatales archaeon]|nr:MAG: hypothetical protein JSW62_05015 [Thermoplasmatales archaeon]